MRTGCPGLASGWKEARRVVMLKFLMLFAAILTMGALVWPLLVDAGYGDFPGDVVVDMFDMHLYLPFGAALLASLALTGVFYLLGR